MKPKSILLLKKPGLKAGDIYEQFNELSLYFLLDF
jgi:hypothetical protein